MARLPTPGADGGDWGDILNEFLSVSHAADGNLNTDTVGAPQLKSQSVTNASLATGTIAEDKLHTDVQTKLNQSNPDLTPYFHKSSDTTDAITESATKKFLTDTDATKLAALSGTNTGDQDLSGLVPKTTTINSKALTGNITLTGADFSLTKTDVGLSNVENTSDANKPVSTAVQTALNGKQASGAYATTNELKNTVSAESPQHIARRLLAQSAAGFSEQEIASIIPTITLGTAGAAPTIAGGIRVAPKRLSTTIIDVLGDPHYEYVGVIPGRLEVSSGDMSYANYLTGGSSQNARNRGRYRTVFTGQVFEGYFRARGASIDYRLYINGRPVTTAVQSLSVATSSRYYLKVDLGSVATWDITLEVVDPEFGGIVIGPTDSIRRPERGLLLVGMGDSHTAGANGVSWLDTWVRRAANTLGVQYGNIAIGGSGYLNATTQNFRNRLTPDLFPLSPDVLVLEGSWNDSSATEPALQAEAAFVFDSIRAALPNALLIAAGPWVINHSLSPTLDAHDATLRAQAQASGWNGYISYRDPMNLKAVSPAWAATTVYGIGDVVVYNGFAQLCISAHTSGASWDQSKWRSTAMVGGTGRVGTIANNGNADVLVSSDTVHGTALAHSVKAALVAASVKRIARAVATGITWAS